MKRSQFRICYYNLNPKFLDSQRLELENKLKLLPKAQLIAVRGLDDSHLAPCDLLVIGAQSLAEEGFVSWLERLDDKIHSQLGIFVPTLIIADVGFPLLASIYAKAAKENWYFDVLSPAHLDSLPIRASNLLRTHDHLHELRRYEEILDELEAQVEVLVKQVQTQKKQDET